MYLVGYSNSLIFRANPPFFRGIRFADLLQLRAVVNQAFAILGSFAGNCRKIPAANMASTPTLRNVS